MKQSITFALASLPLIILLISCKKQQPPFEPPVIPVSTWEAPVVDLLTIRAAKPITEDSNYINRISMGTFLVETANTVSYLAEATYWHTTDTSSEDISAISYTGGTIVPESIKLIKPDKARITTSSVNELNFLTDENSKKNRTFKCWSSLIIEFYISTPIENVNTEIVMRSLNQLLKETKRTTYKAW